MIYFICAIYLLIWGWMSWQMLLLIGELSKSNKLMAVIVGGFWIMNFALSAFVLGVVWVLK